MLETAIKAAKKAGELLEYYFETLLEHEEKEDKSVVTKADLEADKIIIQIIKKDFPGHQILTEENGSLGEKSKYRWVIDPLDGTLNFSRGIPLFCTSIALLEDNEPKIGVVYNPITNSLFQAEKGKGTFWNGEKINVSERVKLSDSIVTMGRGHVEGSKEKTLELLTKLHLKTKSNRILASAALELAWVASARMEGFLGIHLKDWDVAAGLLLVSEAGGQLSGFDGQAIKDRQGLIIASNGKIHQELLEVINA